MDEDFFSTLSKKATGFDLVFALTGALWLVGTVTAFSQNGLAAFAVVTPLWISFVVFFHLVRKSKFKSTWGRAVILFILLHVWKIALSVGVSVAFT